MDGASAMGPIDALWGTTLVAGAALLLVLGVGFVLLTRSHASPGVPVLRCPVSGHLAFVQHVGDEGSYVTDLVTCGEFPYAQPVTCGLPCLTGGVCAWLSERPEA
jgi:hypothetical protein